MRNRRSTPSVSRRRADKLAVIICLSATLPLVTTSCNEGPQTPQGEEATTSTPTVNAALQDEHVTAEEYRSAVESHRNCISQIGGMVGEIHPIGNHELGFEYTFDSQISSEVKEFERAADDCVNNTIRDISIAWANQNVPDSKTRRLLGQTIVTCLKSEGVDIAEGASREEILSKSQTFTPASRQMQCLERNSDFFLERVNTPSR